MNTDSEVANHLHDVVLARGLENDAEVARGVGCFLFEEFGAVTTECEEEEECVRVGGGWGGEGGCLVG